MSPLSGVVGQIFRISTPSPSKMRSKLADILKKLPFLSMCSLQIEGVAMAIMTPGFPKSEMNVVNNFPESFEKIEMHQVGQQYKKVPKFTGKWLKNVRGLYSL